MSLSQIPAIDRSIPKVAQPLIWVIFYLIILPLNWLIKAFGFGPKLLLLITKRQMGAGGAEKVFHNYSPDKHDVFVSTFAKSGTNWLMQIAHQTAFHGKGEYEHIHDVVSWPDMGGNSKMSDRFSAPLNSQFVQQASPDGLRVIKTHLSADHVPYDSAAHYLIVVRDPKEIFVSSYFFSKGNFGPLMTTPEIWFELFLKDFPLNFGSSWAEHTASYWALRDKSNVLVLSYQKMKQDLPGTVQQVADVLGVTLSSEELDDVIKKSSFSYMSNIDHKFSAMPEGALPWGEGSKMIREGKGGNSKEMLTLEQQRKIDEHFQQELKRLNSDFPYRDFCQFTP